MTIKDPLLINNIEYIYEVSLEGETFDNAMKLVPSLISGDHENCEIVEKDAYGDVESSLKIGTVTKFGILNPCLLDGEPD